MRNDLLNVVDDDDQIITTDTRENIHMEGLLHREIHVWFITPQKEIIFQHRGKNKDTFPDLLDATVGGHVELGSNYRDTAKKEAEEETGLEIENDRLKLIELIRSRAEDQKTKKINNVLRVIFAYEYDGSVDSLKREGNKGLGFESYSLENLKNLSDENRKKFIPTIISTEYMRLFEKMVSTEEKI